MSLGFIGPPPFKFQPSVVGISGAAFSLPFKILATLIVAACAAGLIHNWITVHATHAAVGAWFIAGLLLMGYTWWHILRSVTRIESNRLYQSWVWNKHMDMADLAYGKLIRVPALDWLIAPRLYVRTLMGKFEVFYAASPVVLAEFERLVEELKAFRTLR